MSSQGQLSIAFFQVSAFVILLALYLILYKDVKARFLRLWICGWVLLTCSATTRFLEQFHESPVEWAIVQTAFFLAVTFTLAAALEYLRPFRQLNALWLWAILGGAVGGAMSLHGTEGYFLWRWVPAVLSSGTSIAAGWILWRARTLPCKNRPGSILVLLRSGSRNRQGAA